LINPATAWTDMHSVDPQWLVEFEVDAIIPGQPRPTPEHGLLTFATP
jgi:hypothetical protein